MAGKTGQDLVSIEQSVKDSLVSTTKCAGRLANEDIAFYRSLDPAVGNSVDSQNARLLRFAERLLKNAATGAEIEAPSLPDGEAVEGNWRGVIDVVDGILEKADTCLDEYTGVVRRLSPGQQEAPANTKLKTGRTPLAFRSSDMPKPQLLFDDNNANHASKPFKPLLKTKPHAIVPLEQSIKKIKTEDGTKQYPHPYQMEIEEYQYPSYVRTESPPIPYQPFETTHATFVDTVEAAEAMLEELKTAQEIAVDLEHHDARSYVGIVSLMQISTRNQDWIVDTLKPWRRKLQMLNEVFANPTILKVLHGSQMDVIWLQRDLGLYLVGLFDTHHACRTLGYPGASLAFLLKKFVSFDAQKQYQMADWRVRPLPREMFDYARSDTHFLLYIYDNLRNELIEKSKKTKQDCLGVVLGRSKEYALQRYEHQIYDAARGVGPGGWYKLLARTPAMFSREQFAVFKAVHQWRDNIARLQDDSVHYIMPNHAIFSIARAMPDNAAAVLSACQPLTQTVRLKASELVGVVNRTKETGANGPDMQEFLKEMKDVEKAQYAITASTVPDDQPQQASVVTPASSANPGTVVVSRADTSQLWGNTFASSVWLPSSTVAHTEGIQLALPLPRLTAEIFATPSDAVPAHTVNGVHGAPQHTHIKERNPPLSATDDVFTIKQLGGSRKRKSEQISADTVEAIQDPSVIEPGHTPDDAGAERKRRKAEKKAAKKAAKEEAGRVSASDGINGVQQEEDLQVAQPFDYANAPSVLHSTKGRQNHSSSAKAAKAFNPYAKSLDAPKGLGRTQKERAGRSMTYNS